jgi:hypothetical protein
MKGVIAAILFYAFLFSASYLNDFYNDIKRELNEKEDDEYLSKLHTRTFYCSVSKDSLLRNFQKYNNRVSPTITFSNRVHTWDSISYGIHDVPLDIKNRYIAVKFIKTFPNAAFQVQFFSHYNQFSEGYKMELPNLYSKLDSILVSRHLIKP